MKLEFLGDITDKGKYPDVDPDKPIRLYAFNHEEAQQLVNVIQCWVINRQESVDISALDLVQTKRRSQGE